MKFKPDTWSRAFWEHFGTHLRVVGFEHGQPVRVLRPMSCIACRRIWDVDAPAARALERERQYRPRVFTDRRRGIGYWPHAERRRFVGIRAG